MNAETILLRQAHPKFIEGEQITSQVFMPNSGDDGKLSVYDGDLITPADSHKHYTEVSGKLSHSVWGISCEEAANETVPGQAAPLPDFPSHAIMDFTGKTEKVSRKVAKRLKMLAVARGRKFLPG